MKCCGRFKLPIGSENLLLILTVLAVVLGIIIGVVIQATISEPLSPKQISQLKFLGEIFIRALKMIILPLITSSLIKSLATLDTESAGHIGIRAFIYYLCTTLLAVILGIILVVSIQPGTKGGREAYKPDKRLDQCYGGNAGDTMMDLIRNVVPVNLVKAMVSAERTCYKFKYKVNNVSMPLANTEALNLLKNGSDAAKKAIVAYPKRKVTSSMNILGIVVFSIVFGIILGKYKAECQPLIDVFSALEFAIMKLVTAIIWFSPIGIMFLIAAQIVAIENPVEELKRLAWYILTVLVALALHTFVTLMAILILLGRRNPFKFVMGMSQALLTALGTSSSSATMPLTLKCLEEKNGIDPRISRFMIPLGATVNMDGTALYEAIAAIYISQYVGQHLNAGEVILTSLTATLASIGAAGIPGAGLVTLMMVLIAVNLPAELFILIVPVDWFLDRIRTMINVLGDAIGCAVVQRLCRNHLKNQPGGELPGEYSYYDKNPEQGGSNVIFPKLSSGHSSHNNGAIPQNNGDLALTTLPAWSEAANRDNGSYLPRSTAVSSIYIEDEPIIR